MKTVPLPVCLGLLLVGCGGQAGSGPSKISPTPPESQASAPLISPAPQTFPFGGSVSVTITDSTAGATIYYTEDGSIPTPSSTKYVTPLAVSKTETLKAIATASGFSVSPVAAATFTALYPDISGKWVFDNGVNLNLTQTGSAIDGTAIVQTFSAFNSALLELDCSDGNDVVTGTERETTITLSIGACTVTPHGGYSLTATVNANGTEMTGGAWGTGYKVGTWSGYYSGKLSYYGVNGTVIGTLDYTLRVDEGDSHQVLALLNSSMPSQWEFRGTAVGATLNLHDANGVPLTAIVQPDNNVYVSQESTSTLFCAAQCSQLASGVFTPQLAAILR